jgi:hypothetical protein
MAIPESASEIAPLLLKFLRNELSDEEKEKLHVWASSSRANRVFLENISAEKILRVDTDFDEASIWAKIKEQL